VFSITVYNVGIEVLTSVTIKSEVFWIVCSHVSAGFLLRLLLFLEKGGNIFLRKVELSPNYTALQPTRPSLSNNIDVLV
jgi:hypothetical protein